MIHFCVRIRALNSQVFVFSFIYLFSFERNYYQFLVLVLLDSANEYFQPLFILASALSKYWDSFLLSELFFFQNWASNDKFVAILDMRNIYQSIKVWILCWNGSLFFFIMKLLYKVYFFNSMEFWSSTFLDESFYYTLQNIWLCL